MVKGVIVAFGIMLGLMLVPLLNLLGFPFGPFIGAYFGMSLATKGSVVTVPSDAGVAHRVGQFAMKSAVFGSLLGLLVMAILVGVAVGLMTAIDLGQRFIWLLWIGVVVFTMYTATMAALGALYSQLRASQPAA